MAQAKQGLPYNAETIGQQSSIPMSDRYFAPYAPSFGNNSFSNQPAVHHASKESSQIMIAPYILSNRSPISSQPGGPHQNTNAKFNMPSEESSPALLMRVEENQQ